MKPKLCKVFLGKLLTYFRNLSLPTWFSKKDPLDKFFERYPAFKYDRNKPTNEQFRDLRRKFGWRKNKDGSYPKEMKDAEKAYRIAFTQTFNARFGKDFNDNKAWGKLCSRLGVVPVPEKIEDRRKIVVGTHINLVDLTDNDRSSRRLRKFKSVEELKRYTIAENKYFPREEAYAGSLLRWLLREIHNQYRGSRGMEAAGGSKRD